MGGVLIAVLVVVLVMAATIVVALVVLSRVGTRAERRADALRADVERLGEEWVIPLGGAVYELGPGARGDRGHGVLGLTDRRLLFLPIAGKDLSVPRVRVTGAEVRARRRDAVSGHRHLLVVGLDDGGELGFLVDEPDRWLRALAPAAVTDGTASAAESGAPPLH